MVKCHLLLQVVLPGHCSLIGPHPVLGEAVSQQWVPAASYQAKWPWNCLAEIKLPLHLKKKEYRFQ